MPISVTFHIVGMVLWMSGLLMVSSQLRKAAKNNADISALKLVIPKLFNVFVISGAAISIFTGLLQLSIGGMSMYMKSAWMHGKLTLVMFLIVITIFLWRKVALLNEGKLSANGLLAIHIISAVSMFVIILFTQLKF